LGKAHKILIVDDEPSIRTLLKSTLARAGYAVVEAGTVREATASAAIDKPDLILLDLGLPDRDGLEVIGALRGEAGLPVIVVSAREDSEQKVAALDLGAEDYVTKPFDTEELLARIRAALRRSLASQAEQQLVEMGDVRIDLFKRMVQRGGDELHLTPKEYAVLAELAKHPGRVLTHAQLLRAAWGPAQEKQTEYLRVTVRALRQKLEEVPSEPRLILNEPGVGYRLIA
jgi:two-component system, OmpR family, KDP operon response regulator KdpE